MGQGRERAGTGQGQDRQLSRPLTKLLQRTGHAEHSFDSRVDLRLLHGASYQLGPPARAAYAKVLFIVLPNLPQPDSHPPALRACMEELRIYYRGLPTALQRRLRKTCKQRQQGPKSFLPLCVGHMGVLEHSSRPP